LLEIALQKSKKGDGEKKALDIISGCTKASTFVGFVHMMKVEKSDTSQSSSATIEKIKRSVEIDVWQQSFSGRIGNSSSFAKTSKALNSSSNISNHANLVCHGIIPSIVSNEVGTAVKRMAPDAQQIMDQQAAITDASNAGGGEGSVEGEIESGRRGAQFKSLNSEHLKNTVSSLGEYDSEANMVIDTNSMLTALTDFVNKAMAGEGGVPTNFYIKSITKKDIAKSYIKKFYPSGMTFSKDRRRGIMGQSSEDEGGE